jgi:hypothetical protein
MHSINGSHKHGMEAIPWPTETEIAQYAAQLWEQRGRPANCDIDIWLEAEDMLLIAKGYTQPRATRSATNKATIRNGAQQSSSINSSAANHSILNTSRTNL